MDDHFIFVSQRESPEWARRETLTRLKESQIFKSMATLFCVVRYTILGKKREMQSCPLAESRLQTRGAVRLGVQFSARSTSARFLSERSSIKDCLPGR
jgi:hypothetical protein